MVSLEGKGKVEIEKLIQEHRDGKHGPLTEEVKVAVLTFQAVPPGMSPYFVLVGKPQTNNESSEFTFSRYQSHFNHLWQLRTHPRSWLLFSTLVRDR